MNKYNISPALRQYYLGNELNPNRSKASFALDQDNLHVMVVSNKQGDFFVPLTKKLVKLYSKVLPYRRMA